MSVRSRTGAGWRAVGRASSVAGPSRAASRGDDAADCRGRRHAMSVPCGSRRETGRCYGAQKRGPSRAGPSRRQIASTTPPSAARRGSSTERRAASTLLHEITRPAPTATVTLPVSNRPTSYFAATASHASTQADRDGRHHRAWRTAAPPCIELLGAPAAPAPALADARQPTLTPPARTDHAAHSATRGITSTADHAPVIRDHASLASRPPISRVRNDTASSAHGGLSSPSRR